MALEALVSAFLLVVVAAAVPEVVEIVALADNVARNAAEVAEAADIVDDDVGVVADDVGVVADTVAEAVDNSIGAVDVVVGVGAVAPVVQNLPAYKTHPGNATVATAVD